ncbi:spondin domain-containing protein [Undibacterium sp. TS12]|uniref:spondin domain-containing protein n=1 Tax=Undibacterium sp. TS12 TaxID=2908202 RepID=UPI001F4CF3C4|nr:spondin domain-containing protein [Undibacterium sp. TS12]MCH8620426.1 spondin domain-containing protein [Undibacterium sp. TS12]
MHNSLRVRTMAISLATAAVLSACGGHETMPPQTTVSTPVNAMFEVTLVNLTAGQPLSPMVAVAHDDGFKLFSLGETASVELEKLAEGGESAPLAALANASKSVYATAVGSGGPLLPGAGNKSVVSLTVPASSLGTLRFSLASMLGNTNDGFTGISGQSLAQIPVGAESNFRLLSYDAGTERNTESADTVPGPATQNSGGKREGFNPARDDVVNVVTLHPGVVSKDDGLPTSALTQAHRWDNPVAVLTVKRIQ